MANPGSYQLFVYGSLLSGFKSPAYDYISRYFDLVSDGKVKGLLFDMGEYPAAEPAAHSHDCSDFAGPVASAGGRYPRPPIKSETARHHKK